ncbi:MAG: ROK family glucokinase [Ornithinimicrobium sp.]
MQSSDVAIGVDIGGTKVAAGLVDDRGVVTARRDADTPHRSTAATVVEDVIVEVVEALLAEHLEADRRRSVPIGIGAAGFVDADRQTVRFAPHLNWRNEPLAARLQVRLGQRVTLENDANAAAWAEYRFGAGRGEPRLVLITLGTGIGGGMVFDGRLERGRHGMAAEFGHMTLVPDGHRCECGNRGCWEQYASGPALRREATERLRAGGPRTAGLEHACGGDLRQVTGAMVTELATAGDVEAQDVLSQIGTALGQGLANVVAALDPGAIVIGGGVSRAGGLLLEPAGQALARHVTGRGHRPLPPLHIASLGPDAGLIGAADLARRDATGTTQGSGGG